MSRSAFVTLGCVLFGIIATLGISWGSAMWIERDWEKAVANNQAGQFLGSWSTERDLSLNGWNLRVESRFAAQRASATNGAYEEAMPTYLPDRVLPAWSSIRLLPEVTTTVDLYGYIEAAYGWPMVCMRHTWTRTTPEGELDGSRADSLHLAGWNIPVNPVWSGLYINTIFFAAVAFMLLRGPAIVRRYSRLYRGQCPGCAKPILPASKDLCAHCGHPTTWARA